MCLELDGEERRGEYEGSRVEGNGYPFRLSYFNVLKIKWGDSVWTYPFSPMLGC